MYLLPCDCGQNVRVGRAQAGQQVTCVCGKSLTVPTLRGLRELHPAPPEAPTGGKRAWTPIHGALFASGIMVALVAAAIALYSAREASIAQSYTQDRSGEVIEHEALAIDQLPPEELLSLWNQERDHGLGQKGTPLWVAAQERADRFRRWATIAGIAAAVGLVVAVGAVFVGRPVRA